MKPAGLLVIGSLLIASAPVALPQDDIPDIPMFDDSVYNTATKTGGTSNAPPKPATSSTAPPKAPSTSTSTKTGAAPAPKTTTMPGINTKVTLPKPPAATRTATPKPPATPKRTTAATSANNTANPTSVIVKPSTARILEGTKLQDATSQWMKDHAFEVIFSSRQWTTHWNSADMGALRVTSLQEPAGIPKGGLVEWQRDMMGNPMVYLKARVNFPRMGEASAITKKLPIESVPVVIAQAVVFYQQESGWIASASPLYITLEEEKRTLVFVPMSRGQGVWRARVGTGGLYIENFVGAGLAAARTEIARYFTDEEIRLYTQGNSDVIFYLRPQS